jgi:hypothetical protein
MKKEKMKRKKQFSKEGAFLLDPKKVKVHYATIS